MKNYRLNKELPFTRVTRLVLVGALGLPLAVVAQDFGEATRSAQNKGAESIHQNGFEPAGPCIPIYPQGSVGMFDSTFDQSWPAYNARLRIFVSNNQYFSLLFNAGPGPQFGTVTSSTFPGNGEAGVGQISISRVAGCFDPAFLGAGCLSEVSALPSLSWQQNPQLPGCQLIPGDTYYLNYTFGGSAPSGNGPQCPSGDCGRDTGNIAN